MTPDQRWQRVQQLSEQLEALAPADREAALARAESDPSLRSEVLDLLRALTAEESSRRKLLSSSAPEPAHPLAIGPYRILGRLGQGGTSTVYRAQQILDANAPPRDVALKVLNSYLSSPSQIERFQREFSLLARLDHPSICRVFDFGLTPEQQPYLVLELLDAQPIDSYADQHRLTIPQRIALAAEAAEAMAFAHRQLIAHLDLKPGNLFVTAAGRVKVLDFGTAKLIDPTANLTTTRYLTPHYASPEQLRGEPVSTACDVYSLGLIVYELLAGASPFPATSIAALAERASGATVPRRLSDRLTESAANARAATLSLLRQQLSGDIEHILSRALMAEPAQRYASMADFAGDLRRYLDQRPILARPQTFGYRLSKFVRRNRLPVALASVALLAIASTGTFAFLQQREALAQSRRAQEVGNFLRWLLLSSNPQLGGREGMTVQELMSRADGILAQGLIRDENVHADIESLIASILIEGSNAAEGQRLLERAGARFAQTGNVDGLMSVKVGLLTLSINRGDCAAAIKSATELDALLVRHRRSLSGMSYASPAVAIDSTLDQCGQNPPGDRIAEAVRRLPEIPDGAIQNGMSTRLFKALVWNARTHLLVRHNQLPQAIDAAKEGLRLASLDPNGRNIRVALLQALSRVYYAQKNVSAAADSLLEAAQLAQNSATPFEAIRLKVQAGQRLAESGRKEEALTLANEAVAAAQSAALGDKKWMVLIDAAITYSRLNRCPQTYALLREADQLTHGQMPPAWKANRYSFEATCLAADGKPALAAAAARQALDAAGALWPPQSSVRKRMEALLQ